MSPSHGKLLDTLNNLTLTSITLLPNRDYSTLLIGCGIIKKKFLDQRRVKNKVTVEFPITVEDTINSYSSVN